MSQDFETLPVGTEAALRAVADAFEYVGGSNQKVFPGLFANERRAMESARAILAQIDAQREGANDAG